MVAVVVTLLVVPFGIGSVGIGISSWPCSIVALAVLVLVMEVGDTIGWMGASMASRNNRRL